MYYLPDYRMVNTYTKRRGSYNIRRFPGSLLLKDLRLLLDAARLRVIYRSIDYLCNLLRHILKAIVDNSTRVNRKTSNNILDSRDSKFTNKITLRRATANMEIYILPYRKAANYPRTT